MRSSLAPAIIALAGLTATTAMASQTHVGAGPDGGNQHAELVGRAVLPALHLSLGH